jgi:hypothetical protein
MTLEEIEALRAPQQRPAGVNYTDYQRLCFTAGVTDSVSKSEWDSLPLYKGGDYSMSKAGCASYLKSMEMRPKGMGYGAYKAMCMKAECPYMSKADFDALDVDEDMDVEKMYRAMDMDPQDIEAAMVKADDMDDEDMGDDDMDNDGEETETAEADEDDDVAEDEDMDDEGVEKGLRASALMKAISAYEDVEESLGDEPTEGTRENYLQARLDAGTISKSEKTELANIWLGKGGSEIDAPDALRKSLYDTLSEDDDAAQLVDASSFLNSLVKGVDSRMNEVLGEVSRDGRATRELLKAQGSLVKSLANHTAKQDSLIKAMADRIESLEGSPAPRRAVTARRSNVAPRTLQKSVYAGTVDMGDNLSKAQITDGLRSLLVHAADSNDQSAMDRITRATALFEQTGNIPLNIMDAVRQVTS